MNWLALALYILGCWTAASDALHIPWPKRWEKIIFWPFFSMVGLSVLLACPFSRRIRASVQRGADEYDRG